MARQIQSPGVQISEIDLSLRAVGSPVTTILVPGFAQKGPNSEVLKVGSLSEFEQIYGQPTNASERYFYHSVKAAFQSPADVLVYRLPYGEGNGVGTSTEYSALVYPVVTFTDGTSSTNVNQVSGAVYFLGTPTHVKLTQEEFLGVLKGTSFAWSPDTEDTRRFDSVDQFGNAGLIILNKSQSTINSKYEGYYVGIADNTNMNPATEFDEIQHVASINNNSPSVAGEEWVLLPEVRLDFALSATKTGAAGSVSEVMENIPSFDIYGEEFDDTLTIGVFKLRQSVFSPDTITLGYALEEGYTASLDAYRQINSVNGGPAKSFFIENVDEKSTQIITLVNPYISNKAASTWLDINGVPTKKVRCLTSRLAEPLPDEDENDYIKRVGTTVTAVNIFREAYGDVDAIIALGDFVEESTVNKVVGNVPAKLTRLFDKIENYDLYPLTLTVEAGLGTIYVNSFNPATSGYFDDTVAFDTLTQSLTSQYNTGQLPDGVQNYLAVANTFVNFAANTRKDHLFIADPLTNILIAGNGLRTIDDPTKSFSSDLYWPLRNQFSTLDTSYACTFATCVRVNDIAINQQVWVPFSGFAAAAMANTDTNFQPWYAPAGFTRGVVIGVNDLAMYPKQKQRDQLYKVNLNPVAFFPAEGFVIFGQKTLQKKPSAFDRINVRRLFLNLEASTRDTVRFFVFEPNTLFTRTQVINTLTPIFDNAKNTQGIYDYLIICDERNNPPDVIDDNTLVVDIYIKPVRTAEYILANFYATRTGTNFQEIVS